MIKKIKNGYKVVSEKTKRNLGTYKGRDARKRAVKRLRQIEYFKHLKK